MTPEEQRIAIAECFGWGGVREIKHHNCDNEIIGYSPSHPSWKDEEDNVPNYPNDLNAMREIEESLSTGQKIVYADWLCAIQKRDPHVACWDLIHASAAVKSEAVLRTLCKWKD